MANDSAQLIPDELLGELAAPGGLRSFKKGELLVSEGDVAESVFVLVIGRLKVFTRDAKGRELVYNDMRPGEFFGEMLLDGGVRSASVKATEPAACIEIGFSELRNFMGQNPAFAEFVILTLIRRLRHATHQVRGLALNGVYERVVDFMKSEAVEQEGHLVIPSSLTQQEMASRVGATREMISHVVRDLHRGGFLAKDGRRRLVLIKEPPKRW